MPDNDALVLEDAGEVVSLLDVRYRSASFDDQVAIKPERDRAFSAYSAARLKLLQADVICTDADLEEMTRLRNEVRKAADKQSLVIAAAKVAVFLAKLAAKA